MNLTDPIADMLTRIRNAAKQKHATVDVPYSKVKAEISNILLNEGFIADREVVENGTHKNIRITLKYKENKCVIQGLKRISKPGLRIYAEKEELPRVLNGLGIAIISTSKGIVTDKVARKENVGGEVVAYIW
ncbi:MAG: 30S ribosomal protein S8 [Clostridia bacterium]|nr:30S ribosomal protein S8 [Clostridia bacterium]